jgi:glycine/D-amino acid oxidase-like deaminating enzyme
MIRNSKTLSIKKCYMRVAILGGGFAGLAVTWFILHYTQGSSTVDLYDPEPIGGGASGLSSGLLHPYAGKHARLSWEAKRSMQEVHRLMTAASQAIAKPIILSKGILRPALFEEQITAFQTCAHTHSDTEWWDKKTCETKVAGLQLPPEGGGLYISEGLTLDVKTYLQGLWQACALHGTQYHQQAMISQADLAAYDRILIAMGPLTKNFPPLKDLPITAVKGQILELKWPGNITPLPFSLISQKYLVMSPDQKSCLAGATFEHTFTSAKPDRAKAIDEIMPHVTAFFPSLERAEIIAVRAAFRASSHNHLPIVGKIDDKHYFFTGLGSKGLLYHAWVGKRVARALLTKSPDHFPDQLLWTVR